MAETVIGVKFNDFVLVAAAGLGAHYYIKITDTEDKTVALDSHKLMVCSGEDGPRKNFTEFIRCNMALSKVRTHGRDMGAAATANFIRNTLASALRSRGGAYEVNSLLACWDRPAGPHDEDFFDDDNNDSGAETDAANNTNANNKNKQRSGTPYLYYMDYLGTMQPVPYGCHGYGTSFVTAILDCHYRADMTPQEGIDLLQTCVNEIKKRVIISTPHFICKVVNNDGIQLLDNVF